MANDFTPTGDSPRESDDSPGIKAALMSAVEASEKEAEDNEPELPLELPKDDGIKGTDDTPKTDDDKLSRRRGKLNVKPATEEKPETEVKIETAETGPPSNWSDKDKELFKTQPKPVQEFLLGRHRDMEADYTRKSQELASMRTEYKAIDDIFSTQRETLKKANLTPSAVIHGWAQAELALMSGDFNRQANLLAGVAKSYNLDPIKLATHLLTAAGIADPKAALEQAGVAAAEHLQRNPLPAPLPPEVLARLQRVDEIDNHYRQQQQQAMDAAVTTIDSEMTKFKSEKDAAGQLLRPHFDELIETMGQLVNEDVVAKRQVRQLEQLYQDAIFANPAVRQKWLDGRLAAERSTVTTAQQTERDKTAAAARAKSAAARRAGSSVTGSSSGTGQAIEGKGKSNGSLRSALAAAVEAHDDVLN